MLKVQGFNGQIEVALQYKENWCAGYFTQVRLYKYHNSDNDVNNKPTTFKKFRVYTMQNQFTGQRSTTLNYINSDPTSTTIDQYHISRLCQHSI
jgi:hypothetical protein